MLNILICDDDINTVEKISKLIYEFNSQRNLELNISKKYDGASVIAEETVPDIAILDITIPDINGIELAQKLKCINPDIVIIIITSFIGYLDNAMRVNVFRYITKPIEDSRFLLNFEDAVKTILNRWKYIIIETKTENYKIRTSDILFIETLKRGGKIVTTDNIYITNKKPGEWLKIIDMPEGFVYSHNSYLVNLQNVIHFDKEYISFTTPSGKVKYPIISQRKYKQFKEAFFRFVGNL